MYEARHQSLLSPVAFLRRLLAHAAAALLLIGGSLALGMAGYMRFEGFAALDAFLESSMLLGGMGPLQQPITPGGKVFAGLYALYAGLVFLVVAGILIAPVAHRVLHHFHAAADGRTGERTCFIDERAFRGGDFSVRIHAHLELDI